METQEAIELLEQRKNLICHDCVHPAMVGWCENHCKLPKAFDMAIDALKAPEVALSEISELLNRIYRIQSPHLSTEGVIAKQYYCEELWKKLFPDKEFPVWMYWTWHRKDGEKT